MTRIFFLSIISAVLIAILPFQLDAAPRAVCQSVPARARILESSGTGAENLVAAKRSSS